MHAKIEVNLCVMQFAYVSGHNGPKRKKSRIRETKHLSTNADSSTDTIVGWTKNTPKPDFFEKGKKNHQNAKTQKV